MPLNYIIHHSFFLSGQFLGGYFFTDLLFIKLNLDFLCDFVYYVCEEIATFYQISEMCLRFKV
jgi:hypothetical protein